MYTHTLTYTYIHTYIYTCTLLRLVECVTWPSTQCIPQAHVIVLQYKHCTVTQML